MFGWGGNHDISQVSFRHFRQFSLAAFFFVGDGLTIAGLPLVNVISSEQILTWKLRRSFDVRSGSSMLLPDGPAENGVVGDIQAPENISRNDAS